MKFRALPTLSNDFHFFGRAKTGPARSSCTDEPLAATSRGREGAKAEISS